MKNKARLTIGGRSVIYPVSKVPGVYFRADSKKWRWEVKQRSMVDGKSSSRTVARFDVEASAVLGSPYHLETARQNAERFALQVQAKEKGKVGVLPTVDVEALTLEDWLNRYLDDLENSQLGEDNSKFPNEPIVNKGWKQEKSLLKTLLGQASQGFNRQGLPQLIKVRIAEITADYALDTLRENWKGNHGKKASPDTIKKVLTQLSLVYNRAIQVWNYEVKNPFSDLKDLYKRKKLYSKSGREVVISLQDFRVIKEELYYSHITTKAGIYFISATGCRRGECVKLQWEDIDFTGDIPTAHLKDTKAKSGKEKNRYVPLIDRALVALKVMSLLQRYEKVMGVRVPVKHPDLVQLLPYPTPKQWEQIKDTKLMGSIFQIKGHSVMGDTITQAWDRARNRASKRLGKPLIAKMRIHDLRHTAITRFVDEGQLNPLAVGQIVGHSNPQTTKRYYHGNAKVIGQMLKINIEKHKTRNTDDLLKQLKGLPKEEKVKVIAFLMD